jgi:hypothetical protein|tara:strand:+ start:722 stop:928 length:207 start_codon:yes stop_codon:yes gene_type:complete
MAVYILYTDDGHPIPIWDGESMPKGMLDNVEFMHPENGEFNAEQAGLKLKQYLDQLNEAGLIEEATGH